MLGDVHGSFSHVLESVTASGEKPLAVVFLGDLECPMPFSDCVAEIEGAGIQCWAIPGNHDTDSRENYINLWGDPLFQQRNLHGRVAEIAGMKVAGLGGVFRGRIWKPEDQDVPAIRNWQAYQTEHNSKRPSRFQVTRPTIEQIGNDGLLRKHSSSIFFDDWFQLYGQPADILVTHEAPDCHPHGFAAIGALAQSMRVKFAFHGHHHCSLSYREHDARLGFQAFGVGLRGITDMFGGGVRVGCEE